MCPKGVGKPKPYSKNRPSYRKGQVDEVWENAKDTLTGKVYDPTGKEITWDKTKPRNGQWDMGHIPGEKYSEMHKLYMDGTITKKEFLEWYKNPKNYRPELPSTNRSHKYE
nr:HNH/ENDO VII family nuclease [uncultured Clostridium sp.]